VLYLNTHADLDDNPFSHASPFAGRMDNRIVKTLTQVGSRTFNAHQRIQAARFNVGVVEMKNFNSDFSQSLSALYPCTLLEEITVYFLDFLHRTNKS
jgi:hypothetical protein